MASTALTVAQAARLVGRPKATLVRAIEAGLLSARRGEDGAYTIDSGELERRRADWDVPQGDRRRASDKPDPTAFGV